MVRRSIIFYYWYLFIYIYQIGMKDVSLKTIVQEDKKTVNIPQLYICGMDFLRYDIIEILNRQMSRDYKIEF